MIGWLQSRSDLRFMHQFRQAVFRLWTIESRAAEAVQDEWFALERETRAAVEAQASRDPEYQGVREEVTRGLLRAVRVAQMGGVSIDVVSYPPPAIGGPVIPVNLFHAILQDTSHGGVKRQWILDQLNQTIGATEARVWRDFLRMLNPFHWAWELLVFIIRIPFLLVEASGFNVSKVEDHFLAKAFKLADGKRFLQSAAGTDT